MSLSQETAAAFASQPQELHGSTRASLAAQQLTCRSPMSSWNVCGWAGLVLELAPSDGCISLRTSSCIASKRQYQRNVLQLAYFEMRLMAVSLYRT